MPEEGKYKLFLNHYQTSDNIRAFVHQRHAKFSTDANAERCKKQAQPGSIRHVKIRFLYDVDPSATGG
jgi:hypothetical protein